MHLVGAGLGDDVDHPAAGPAVFRRVVAAVDLELLHRILAQCEADAAGIVIRFRPIHGDAVSAPIAAVEGEAALGRLGDAEVGVVGKRVRIHHTRHQQGVGEIITAVDGQSPDVLLGDGIRLMRFFQFHQRSFRRDDDFRDHRGYLQWEIHNHGLSHRHHDAFPNLCFEALEFSGDVVGSRGQAGHPVCAGRIRHDRAPNSLVGIDHNHGRLRNHRPGRISYGAPNVARSAHALRVRCARAHHQESKKQGGSTSRFHWIPPHVG